MDAALPVDPLILGGAALLAAGILAARAAERLRVPGLLLFLGLGMLIGDDGLGLIHFSDAGLAQDLAVVALVAILFEGGLGTDARHLRKVGPPAVLLATVGVGLTAGVVGLAATWLLHVPIATGLLVGAVVASTDAAAVFGVLRSAPLPARLRGLLEAESGFNDPMAVLLTVGLLAASEGSVGAGDWAVFAVRQVVGGLVAGAVVGVVGSAALRRLHIGPALGALLCPAIGGLAFGAATMTVHGSGFLAVYVAGVVVGARPFRHGGLVRRFGEGVSTAAEIGLFLLLGLLGFPSRLLDDAWAALAVAAVLVLVARPLAVAACLPWFRFRVREQAIVAWVGLRGAVPIVLATFPLTRGHAEGGRIFDVVFFVVLVSAAVQGVTAGPLARRLDVGADPEPAPLVEVLDTSAEGLEVVEVALPADLRAFRLADRPLPAGARVATVLRAGGTVVPDGTTELVGGDRLLVVAPLGRGDVPAELEAWASSTEVAVGA